MFRLINNFVDIFNIKIIINFVCFFFKFVYKMSQVSSSTNQLSLPLS